MPSCSPANTSYTYVYLVTEWTLLMPVYFISGSLSLMLYGTTCAQMLYYCYHYIQSDGVPLRWLVAFIGVLDTVITVADVYVMWALMIPIDCTNSVQWMNIGNDSIVPELHIALSIPWPYYLEYAAVSVTAFIVQIFYIHCIWQLLKSARSSRCRILVITVPPAILSFGSLLCSSGTIYILVAVDSPIVNIAGGGAFPSFSAGTAMLADIYILVTLSWSFHKMKTGFKHTDGLLQSLSLYVINRGLLTAAAQTGVLMVYVITQGSPAWLAIHCIGGKLYVNSMMAMLNDRQYLKEKYTPSSGFEL